MGNILREIRQRDFSLDGLAEAYPDLNLLKGVKQNPQYHAEGDVYRHTRLVCEEMRKLGQWQRLSEREQELLFLAGAFHDIGKPACTRLEDGKWTSPKHTIVGEKVFRAMAYRGQERFGLTFEEREQTARLIRYHGLPVWFWTKRRPEFDLLKAAESVPLEFCIFCHWRTPWGGYPGSRRICADTLNYFTTMERSWASLRVPIRCQCLHQISVFSPGLSVAGQYTV